jgi:hypothetical protein
MIRVNELPPTNEVPLGNEPLPQGSEAFPSAFRRVIDEIGLLPPRQGADPFAHRRGEPRGLAVLWLVYVLLVSALVFASLGGPLLGSGEGYRQAAKSIQTLIAFGSVVLWPMLRLSQSSPPSGGLRSVGADLVVLLIPVQALLWPQVLLTGWPVSALACVALIAAAWTAGTGAAVGWAIAAHGTDGSPLFNRSRAGGHRTAVLALVVAASVVGPVGSVVLGPVRGSEADPLRDSLLLSSPLTAHWVILRDTVWSGSRATADPSAWRAAWLTAAAALAAWGIASIALRNRVLSPRVGA